MAHPDSLTIAGVISSLTWRQARTSAQKAAFSLLAVAAFALVLVLAVTMISDRRPPHIKVQTIYNVPFYDSVQTIRRFMSRWLASVATAENQKA
jgi:hypothetical protein